MNEREVSEIKRRFRPDRSNITHVRGCYVSDQGEVYAQFNQSVGLMMEDEQEKTLAILKKTLSGKLGKNLLDISFPTKQVKDGAEHKLLMRLRDSKLEDDDAVEQFFQKVVESVSMDTNYMILLACDAYDVPFRSKDGGNMYDASDEVYTYVLCSICPVKLSKSALSFQMKEQEIHNSKTDWIVGSPDLGFLFPAFDDRSTNLYGALQYTRSASAAHEEFFQNIFGIEAPMTADEQKETFQNILASSLSEDCTMTTVQTVHEKFCDMIQEHKESRSKEPLVVSKSEINYVLKTSGLSNEKTEAFNERFEEHFGSDTVLHPNNLVDPQHFVVLTPDVRIQVSPDKKHLIETRVMGGAKFILIRAEEGVEVNGVPVQIN